MPFYGVIEVTVHFCTFRNIDILTQGIFRLKCALCIPQGDPPQLSGTLPFAYKAFSSGQDKERTSLAKAFHAIQDSTIDLQDQAYLTRSFFIKYKEEEVELNESIKFQYEIEIPSPSMLEKNSCYLQVDLLALPLLTDKIQNEDEQSLIFLKDMIKTQAVETCCSKIYKIKNNLPGFNNFIPVTFNGLDICSVTLLLSASLNNIRWRQKPSLPHPVGWISSSLKAHLGLSNPSTEKLPTALSHSSSSSDISLFAQTHASTCIPTLYPRSTLAPPCLPILPFLPISPSLAFKGEEKVKHTLPLVSNRKNLTTSFLPQFSKPTTSENVSLPPFLEEKEATSLPLETLDAFYTVFLRHFLELFQHFACTWNILRAIDAHKIESTFERRPEITSDAVLLALPGTSLSIDLHGSLFCNKRRVLKQPLTLPLPNEILSMLFPVTTTHATETHLLLITVKKHLISQPCELFSSSFISSYFSFKESSESSSWCFPFPSLSWRDKNNDFQERVAIIAQDMSFLAGQIFLLNKKISDISLNLYKELEFLGNIRWKDDMKIFWNNFIMRKRFGVENLVDGKHAFDWKSYYHDLETYRQKSDFTALYQTCAIEDIFFTERLSLCPLILEQRYCREDSPSSAIEDSTDESDVSLSVFFQHKPEKLKFNHDDPCGSSGHALHLFILVHGYNGSSADMTEIKNFLSFLYPHCYFFVSKINENASNGNIFTMGLRLASEIDLQMKRLHVSVAFNQISFVSFSLGGLIVRAALPHLHMHASKFYTFLSLASPHLGYICNFNKWVDAGLWMLNTFSQEECMKQITLSDAEDFHNTALYKLSTTEGLNWFRWICLISSWQDQYTPYESTRIEVSQRILSDVKNSSKFEEMAQNLLGSIPYEKVVRIDVNFDTQSRFFEKMIGRAAHIEFLSCECLIAILGHTCDYLFK